jgi:hypothetical protein
MSSDVSGGRHADGHNRDIFGIPKGHVWASGTAPAAMRLQPEVATSALRSVTLVHQRAGRSNWPRLAISGCRAGSWWGRKEYDDR